MDSEQKVAVITGASGGIGAALVNAYRDRNYRVVATARDAMMLNYKVFFVSDANACRTDEEHNATLAIMMGMFADVRSTDEMIALLQQHAAPLAGAAE